MPRQRATSPTIYSELVKWDLTIWCFHEYVLICFRCFRRIRSNTVILVLHIPLGTGTMVRLVSLVAQVYKLLFFPRLDCILINTQKSLKALFLNFQTFLQGTHIEPVGTSSFKKDSSLESFFFDLGFPPSNIDEIPPRVP